MKSFLLLLLCLWQTPLQALTEFQNVQWVEDPANRADAFRVRIGDAEQLIQLYFVQAPSPANPSEVDLRYFAITDEAQLHAGATAALQATRRQLRAPFTLHTRRVPVPDDPDGRILAFITTSEGADLAAYLVRAGYARPHGFRWETPRGIDRAEMSFILEDAADAAKLERAGLWAFSQPLRLPGLRAQQRRAERGAGIAPAAPATLRRVNVNTADPASLMSLPGVDEVLAGRIERGRPYRTVRDLLDVRGIGENLLNSWEGLITTE